MEIVQIRSMLFANSRIQDARSLSLRTLEKTQGEDTEASTGELWSRIEVLAERYSMNRVVHVPGGWECE